MLTVSPWVAVMVLVSWHPESWRELANPMAILVTSFFGVMTTPLWPTYIPAIVVTPLIMRCVAGWRYFKSWSLWIILGLAFIFGAMTGVGVISIVVPWRESLDLILNWLAAGAVSGGVTGAVIAFIYRYEKYTA